ncbi:hypothetical protein [Nocardia brevicatena]|nr:hypothetical protein [Nocardia brevicatena]
MGQGSDRLLDQLGGALETDRAGRVRGIEEGEGDPWAAEKTPARR